MQQKQNYSQNWKGLKYNFLNTSQIEHIQYFSAYCLTVLKVINCLSYISPKMTQQMNKTGRQLNASFVPGSLLRKGEAKALSSLASKYEFQKTMGNAFIQLEPAEVKFAGYELGKSYTTNVKVINRAPVPQRISILPPEEPGFSIKTNKKGSIASGMFETITVVFRSNEHKYQHDVVKIITETDNFIIPLYAYPSLPDLRAIFPRLIDFGNLQIKESSTYYYPIRNNVPINFQFQFSYQKQCQEIIIMPLSGVIQALETLTVQITFLPTSKHTYAAEVLLSVKQFDFQPLPISIVGNGVQKQGLSVSKRVKSSKLAPLKAEEEGKKTPSVLLRKPSGQIKNVSPVPVLNQTLGTSTLKRSNIRTNYPRLMSAKRQTIQQQPSKTLNPTKIAQKEYQNRYNRIQQLDKEKQIKFSPFLGDKAMNETQIEFQRELVRQIEKVRNNALQSRCTQRYNPEVFSDAQVQLKIVSPKQTSWDDKKNDEHHARRKALLRFMNAGSKVILKYRLLKRLDKIKEFLSDCHSRQMVRKKVEESYAKAIDQQQGISLEEQINFNFGFDSLHPTYFSLQTEENNDLQKETILKAQGKTSFDDLAQVKQLVPHKLQHYKLSQLTYGPDFYHHTKIIPKPRASGQEEYCLKSSALPAYQPFSPTSVYSLPIRVPAHHFIYDFQGFRRYKNYPSKDQKDPQVLLEDDSPLQDEFLGWTGGQMQILKAKFTRNSGCEYISFNSFNSSYDRNPLSPMLTLAQSLPDTIQQPQTQDVIEEGDSDEEDLNQLSVDEGLKLIQLVEGANNQLKQRRAKKIIKNPQKQMKLMLEKNLKEAKQKALGQFVGKIRESNRWVQRPQNRFII